LKNAAYIIGLLEMTLKYYIIKIQIWLIINCKEIGEVV